MKQMLKKFSNSTTAKIVAALLIPGGFIIWVTYELIKAIKSKSKSNKGNE